jgi:5-methylthioadenosine/S-adenosylhomocysteine deaminase
MVVNNIPGIIVTLMDTSNVANVFIAGKVMKWQGSLVGVDMPKLHQEWNKALDGLFERSKFPRNMFGTCCSVT